MGFGAQVREARRARGLLMKDVTARCGVPHANLSLYERGLQHPTAETLARLCTALGLDFDAAWRQIGREKGGKAQRDVDGVHGGIEGVTDDTAGTASDGRTVHIDG